MNTRWLASSRTSEFAVLARGVKYCAIHAIGEFDGAEDLVIRSAHHLDAAEVIVAIGDDQLIGFREKERSMWLAEPGDAVKVLAIEIEHLNGLMVLSGEKQPLALEIQCEMVEVARKPRQWGGGH